jgi:cation transport regulator
MPYVSNQELPLSVREHLPLRAQEIFLATFNRTYEDREGDPRQEEIAFRIAWSAVKKRYHKVGSGWQPNE